MEKLQALYREMTAYFSGQVKRVQHFIKVESIAKWIGIEEQLTQEDLFILEAAALVHDIGIKPAEEKFGNCNGKLQEQEGPQVAREMLQRLGFEETVIERVCYLVGHHHTYTDMDGLDYQILVEADFLVNFHEDHMQKETVQKCVDKIFQTKAGKELAKLMYDL